ncbi:UDP binding domain-containing protein, partial [Flavobacterium macacae]|uniref:UDP binding domain-containing protein n=1 Tax=Flavobacterium macacae TaxID=2488993 RepID=UPI002939239A
QVTVSNDPYEACEGAHAIAVLTEWDEFKAYDWKKIYHSMQKPAFVFDGRNVLDGKKLKEIGFVYQGIGA